MTITSTTSVPLASANIAFFWKMKQIVLINQNITTTEHKVAGTYAIRKNNGENFKIALWISTEAGVKQLNVGVSDAVPSDHDNREFDFSDDAGSIWLDKGASGTSQNDQIVIGTGDIRGIAGNPPGEVTCVSLNVNQNLAVILTCADDFMLTVHAVEIPEPVSIPKSTIKN